MILSSERAVNSQEKIPRRHHYIPRFYLAGFGNSGNSGTKLGQTWTTNVETDGTFPDLPYPDSHKQMNCANHEFVCTCVAQSHLSGFVSAATFGRERAHTGSGFHKASCHPQ